MAFLGDIDHDGFGDIAVGAPYGGPEGRGAVYIYRGSKEGLREKYSQVIFSTDLEEPLQTFGFSLAGGLDLDYNTYPDLVVGAYESDAAVFFRSRPVIQANCKVEFYFDNHSKLSGINLEKKDCDTGVEKVSCLKIKASFDYTSELYTQQAFDLEIILDAGKPKNPRLFFLISEGRNRIVEKNISVRNGTKWDRVFKVGYC